MALSKSVIKSQMLIHGGDLVEAITEANLRLCEESADAMFVTVWLGMITLSTGVLEFVNGGHTYAAVKRGNGEFTLEKDIHGIVVGALDFAKYSLNTTTLNKGDVIYLYTDGITEAHNSNDEMFGEEGLLKTLNEGSNLSPEELDNLVRQRVNEFAGEAEQFDDMTTLCFKYLGT
jgi:sigma-B regulation protein RsbU (phosphoserine phosphatase)